MHAATSAIADIARSHDVVVTHGNGPQVGFLAMRVVAQNGDYDEAAKLAQKLLHTPYLWGGRSPGGMDCSGLVQVVAKVVGLPLPRDAYQQAEEGRTLHFLHEVRAGDLAFFENEEGRITHVGILLDQERIIHASGEVRIDRIDHQGIFHGGQKRYTHPLRLLKRVL